MSFVVNVTDLRYIFKKSKYEVSCIQNKLYYGIDTYTTMLLNNQINVFLNKFNILR